MHTNQPDAILATVGKQPMPILIPILQLQPAVTTQLIVTQDVKEVAKHVRQALQASPDTKHLHVYTHVPVDPYRTHETRERCEVVLASDSPRYRDRQFVINVTGGTTLMAMGAQQAARAHGVPMLYVDTDDGVIVHLSPDGGETDREPITVVISARVYLAAHGASVSPKPEWGAGIANDEPWIKPFREAAGLLGKAGSHSQRLLDEIRLSYNQPDRAATLTDASDRERDLINQLAQLGLLTDVQQAGSAIDFRPADDKRKRKFLEGHWLEVYVHDTCRQSQWFDDVMLSVTVKRPAKPKTVENELDVIVTRHGRLAAISCKTGLKETKDEDVNKEAVYELDSLLQAESMGLYARKLLVTNRGELSPALLSRAYHSQIECVAGSQLPDVASIIKEHLAG